MSPDEIPAEQREAAEQFILGQPADPDSPSERFYAGAIQRIQVVIVLLGALGCLYADFGFGIRAAVGFMLGAVLSWWNLRSLVSAVTTLAGRIVEHRQAASGTSIVLRFIVRIPLVALAAYAILVSSPGSLKGFLVGLCVPVAAVLWEAGYEAFAAMRRGF